jgi:ABC-type dipeptide/oligopeptide/nickel transport system permease component
MTTYVLNRLVLAVPVLFGVTLIVFLALRLAPGDPAQTLAGFDADRTTVEAVRREFGLDHPLPQQYLEFLGNLGRLELGRSMNTRRPVAAELAVRVPVTATLAVSAVVLAAGIGIPLGILAARFQRTWIDYLVTVIAVAGVAVPNYVLGLLLILLFAVTLNLLPATGASGPLNFVLPVVTIASGAIAVIGRQTRSATLEVLGEDYIRTAQAKGLADRAVLFRHALRNALIPVITVIGQIFGVLLGGTIIVETVFAVPGVGKYMIDRILLQDYPAVQGGVLLIALSYVFVNLIVDLCYALVDKRVSYR